MRAVSSTPVQVFTGNTALGPSQRERVMRARGDMRLGVPIVLTCGGEAALVLAIDMLTPERHAALAVSGQACHLALTRKRLCSASRIPLPEGEVLHLPIAQDAPLSKLRAIVDPAQRAGGGRIDTLLSAISAVPAPRLMAGTRLDIAAIALAKAAQLLPAAVMMPLPDGPATALRHGLSLIDSAAVMTELAATPLHAAVASAFLPMAVSQSGRVHVYRPDDGSIEHYAIEVGTPDLSRPVLVRLHSACFTGDVLGSLKCDCGPQLHAACAAMAEAGGGVLVYLNQEGRGIGMANKMRAYALQDRGLDTVEANHQLGFDDDERDFRHGAAVLRQLGIGQVRLLTNNPAKLSVLSAQGLQVTERVPLTVGKTEQNARYLATKAAKSGHILS
jgi:GTP cyclohydrolase II